MMGDLSDLMKLAKEFKGDLEKQENEQNSPEKKSLIELILEMLFGKQNKRYPAAGGGVDLDAVWSDIDMLKNIQSIKKEMEKMDLSEFPVLNNLRDKFLNSEANKKIDNALNDRISELEKNQELGADSLNAKVAVSQPEPYDPDHPNSPYGLKLSIMDDKEFDLLKNNDAGFEVKGEKESFTISKDGVSINGSFDDNGELTLTIPNVAKQEEMDLLSDASAAMGYGVSEVRFGKNVSAEQQNGINNNLASSGVMKLETTNEPAPAHQPSAAEPATKSDVSPPSPSPG